MSNNSTSDFHKRLAKIEKSKGTPARAKRSDRMGIYDAEEEKRRKANRFPWRKLMFTLALGVVGLIAVKTFMVRDMGEEKYQARLTELREGEGWEPYGAIIASRDPLMMVFERLLSSDSDEPKQNAPEIIIPEASAISE